MGRDKEQVMSMETFRRQVSNRNVRKCLKGSACQNDNHEFVEAPQPTDCSTGLINRNLSCRVMEIEETLKKLETVLQKEASLKTPEKCIRLCLQEITEMELFHRAEALLYLETDNCLSEIAEPEDSIILPDVNRVRYELLERAKIAEEVLFLSNVIGETGVITIPITYFEEFFGVICLHLNSKELTNSCSGFNLGMKYLGNLLGNYLKFNKIHKKHAETKSRLISLQDAVQKVSTNLNQPKVLTEIVKLAAETVNAKFAWLSLVRKETQFLSPDAFVGLDLEYLKKISVTIDDSITAKGPSGKAIKTKSPQLITDTQSEPDFAPWRDLTGQLGYKTILAVPILFNDTALGMIAVYSSHVNAFDSEDIEILQAFANFSAVIINYASLFEELEQRLHNEQQMYRQVERQNQLLEHSQKIFSELSRFLIKGQSIDEIVCNISKLLQNPIVVEDRMGILSWRSDFRVNDVPFSKHPEFTREKRILLEQQQPVLLCSNSKKGYHHDQLVAPIILENEVWGYVSIVAVDKKISKVDWMVLDKAATILATALVKEKNKFEIEQQMGCGLIANLCDREKSNEEIVKQAAYLGFDLQKPFYSLVVDFGNSQLVKSAGQKLLTLQAIKYLKDYLDSYFSSSLLTWDEQVAVIFVGKGCTSLEGNLFHGLVNAIRQCLGPINLKQEVTIVFCGLLNGINDLRKAFLEALEQIELAQILDRRGGIFTLDDFNIYDMIYKLYKKEGLEWLENWVHTQLANLISYERSTMLIETLFAFMETDKQIQRAAEKLFIHPNTMSYRLKKVEELLGISFDSLETSEKIFFSLRGYKLLHGLKKLRYHR